MTRSSPFKLSHAAIVLLCLSLCLSLAGCGRRGGLELPPGTPVSGARALPTDPDAAPPNQTDLLGRPGPAEPPPRSAKPFFLDPLL